MKPFHFTCAVLLIIGACRNTKTTSVADQWTDYRKGYALLNQKQDSAFYYFNRAASNATEKDVVALAYYNMALIQAGAGDNYGAQESVTMSLKALDELKPGNRAYLANDYNELGLTSSDLNQDKEALGYYQLALRYLDNKNFKPYILNNQGNSYKKLKKYVQALKSYREVMDLISPQHVLYPRLLTNIALTKWLNDPHYNAVPELLESLSIRLHKSDSWGENSSYAHLSDFYLNRNPDSALYYSVKMLAVATRIQSPDDQLEALQKLIILSRPEKVKGYFDRYHTLRDSVENSRNASKNQFALIRYNVEKSKADNVQLQKEIVIRRYELTAAVVIFGLAALCGIFWYRKRRREQELDKQRAVREVQRKASKKVHDTLANDMYQMMKEVQHDVELDRDRLVYNINDMYQRARDISYELNTKIDGPFHERLSQLLTSFATETTRVSLIGNSEDLWQKVDPAYHFELKYIMQELMVNMQKHSRAETVIFKFEEENGYCIITYTDNGIGFGDDTKFNNGLTNTGNRIRLMQGDITFDRNVVKGLRIHISIPTLAN